MLPFEVREILYKGCFDVRNSSISYFDVINGSLSSQKSSYEIATAKFIVLFEPHGTHKGGRRRRGNGRMKKRK